ncbi:MAG: cytochrome b N-terminal domain-containing protein [Anaerolineae bacterium]|nr:cytochrome b N-terminal domain-containing protein [Anaerolineae bacterium]
MNSTPLRESSGPEQDRARMRHVMNDLILHLHPPRVNARALRFSYTFGLGGAAVLLLLVQVITGALLMFAYRPTPAEAYLSIVTLETQVWFGQLIRNLHHWSANLLLVVVVLHLLRVFYTAAFRGSRRLNWELGLGMLGLTMAANFTGYLLPWDQLSYWAVTVGTSLLSYIPLIGEGIRRLLLGGPEVGAATLSNFYTLHVMALPLGFLIVGMYHLWRVRKDKFSTPRRVDEPAAPPLQMVTTLPHLVSREVVFALLLLALLLAWATGMDAPLLQAADPNHPPDPARAAWYFAGVQELLFHFHPTFGAFVIPALVIGALIALPYLRDDQDCTGIWFRSQRGRGLVLVSLLLGAGAAVGLVWFSRRGDPFDQLAFLPEFIRNGLLPVGAALLVLWAYRGVLRRFSISPGEVRMALFTLLWAVFLVLTVVGALLRGPGMMLMVPGAASP